MASTWRTGSASPVSEMKNEVKRTAGPAPVAFTELPLELLAHIANHLDHASRMAFILACRSTAACAQMDVHWLCERVIDHFGGEEALVRACRVAHVSAVRCLLQLPAARPLTKACLVAAVETGSQPVVAELLAAGAPLQNKKDCPALYVACQHGHEQLVAYLLQHLQTVAPPSFVAWAAHCGLSRAAAGNCMGVARCLLREHGAHPAALTCGALWQAAKNGNVELCQLLLTHGADVHDASDAALRIAATNGHMGAVQCLLDAGADLHACEGGALVQAAGAGRTEVCRMLLERGADPCVRNGEALAVSAEGGWQDIVLVLLLRMAGLPAVGTYVHSALARVGPRIDIPMLLILQLLGVGATCADLQRVVALRQGPDRNAVVLDLLRTRGKQDLEARLLSAARVPGSSEVLVCVSLGVDLDTHAAAATFLEMVHRDNVRGVEVMLTAGGSSLLQRPCPAYDGAAYDAVSAMWRCGCVDALRHSGACRPGPSSAASSSAPLTTCGEMALCCALSHGKVDMMRALVRAGCKVTADHICASLRSAHQTERELTALLELAGRANPSLVDVPRLQDAFNSMTMRRMRKHRSDAPLLPEEPQCLFHYDRHPLIRWLLEGDAGVMVVLLEVHPRKKDGSPDDARLRLGADRPEAVPTVRLLLPRLSGCCCEQSVLWRVVPAQSALSAQLDSLGATPVFSGKHAMVQISAPAERAHAVQQAVLKADFWQGGDGRKPDAMAMMDKRRLRGRRAGLSQSVVLRCTCGRCHQVDFSKEAEQRHHRRACMSVGGRIGD